MENLKYIQNLPFLNKLTLGKYVTFDFTDSPFFGSNKNTHYLIGVLEDTVNLSGSDKFTFNMTDQDVFISTGTTPPPCLYYGYTPYLFKRNGNVVFSSINDTINMNIVEFLNNIKYQSPFLFIMSKNPFLLDHTYDNVVKNPNFSNYAVYKVPIPDVFLPDDKFLAMLRVASINQIYIDFLQNTNNFFMKLTFDPIIKDTTNHYCFYQPDDVVVLNKNCKNGFYQKQRETTINENIDAKLVKGFQVYTDTILKSIYQQRFVYSISKNSKSYDFIEIDTHPYGFVNEDGQYVIIDTGYSCIDNNVNCLGDNRDTIYRVTDPILTENIDFIVITAVNHVHTKKAVYNNINVYNAENDEPVYNVDVVEDDISYYYIVLKNDLFKKAKNIVIAERVYLQDYISPSLDTTIPYKVFIYLKS